MPSPVRSRAMYRLCMGLGLLLLSAGCANTRPAIIAGPQTAISEPWPFGSLVAHGSRGHRLEIATEAGVFDHATATLIFGGQTWRDGYGLPAVPRGTRCLSGPSLPQARTWPASTRRARASHAALPTAR